MDQNHRLIHTTDRERFKRCRLAWHFSSPLRLNLQPIKRNRNLTFGTAWHGGLQSYYEPSTPRTLEALQVGFRDTLLASFRALPNPTVEDEEKYTEALQLGLGMCEHYFNFSKANDRFEVIWVEKEFLIPIPGIDGALYTLKPDGLIQDEYKRYWILENKSADKLSEDTDYLLMDEQCGSYIWGVQIAEEIKIEGVLYNIARKAVPTKLKQLKSGHLSTDMRQMTTYEYAKADIIKHYGGSDAVPWNLYREYLDFLRGEPKKFFQRELVRRNRSEIELLPKMIAMEARDMLDPDLPIYRSPNRFNCSGCAFVVPCLATYDGTFHESLLEGEYEHG